MKFLPEGNKPVFIMSQDSLQLEIENIGGIESESISIDSGVTVLSGENATNRTSLMKALMAALGYDGVPIRSGTDKGKVNIKYQEEVYKRTVESVENDYVWEGDGVVDNDSDIKQLDLFSFLTEQNRVRQAVAAGENLYDIVMDPIDTDKIEAEIQQLKQEREKIEELELSLEDKRDRIRDLEQEVESHLETKSDLEERLEQVNEDIAAINEENIQEEKIDKSKELNNKLKQLTNEKADIEREIDQLEGKIESRKQDLSEFQNGENKASIEELQTDIDNINEEIADLDDNIKDLESDKRVLSPFKRFLSQITGPDSSPEQINRVASKYTDGNATIAADPAQEDFDNPTDALLEDSSEHCVLCGSVIEDNHYEDELKDLNSIISTINSKNSKLQDEINELRDKKETKKSNISSIQRNNDKIESLRDEIDSIEDKIENKREDLSDKIDEIEQVQEDIETVEDEAVKEAENKTGMLRDLESKKTEIEIDIESNESDIESKRDKISSLKEEVNEIATKVADRKPEINKQLEDLRGRVDTVEQNVVDQFNTRMKNIIDELGYPIERIWIEKKTTTVKEGRRKKEKPVFDLNIVREVDGVATADDVNNLSESEREVTGIILALTGYLVHDVGDACPIIMMDSVEMIDAERLESLLNYVGEHVKYLIVATLPEDTDVMDVERVIDQDDRPDQPNAIA